MHEPMSEKLGRLPTVGFWIIIMLLVAALVIFFLGSIIGLMVQAQEPQAPHPISLLMSEFFWGLIVGLLLSVIGAYCLAVFTTRQQQKAQRDLIKNFCIDTVDNIKTIVDDMVDRRQQMQVIHGDYLTLLDIEFNVFAKNRKQIGHLPNPVRDNVRKFAKDAKRPTNAEGQFLNN